MVASSRVQCALRVLALPLLLRSSFASLSSPLPLFLTLAALPQNPAAAAASSPPPPPAFAVVGAATTTPDRANSRITGARDRPLLYGSGYIYPSWKSFEIGSAEAVAWETANMARLAEMGAKLTGASFNWVAMQPEKDGPYNWTATDATVAAAASHGIKMIAYVRACVCACLQLRACVREWACGLCPSSRWTGNVTSESFVRCYWRRRIMRRRRSMVSSFVAMPQHHHRHHHHPTDGNSDAIDKCAPNRYMGNTPDWALAAEHKGLGFRFPPLPQFTPDFQRWTQAVAERYSVNVTMSVAVAVRRHCRSCGCPLFACLLVTS